MNVGLPIWMLLVALLAGVAVAGFLYFRNKKQHYGKAVSGRQIGVHVFEVGKIDVDVGSECLKRFHTVVAACVVHDSGAKTSGVEFFNNGRNAVGIMRGANKTDDVLGQRQHLGNALYDSLHTLYGAVLGALRTDFVILTINTLQIAMGKKDITDAFFSANRGLFAPMHTNCGRFGNCTGIAKAVILNSVNVATSWTIQTFHTAKILKKSMAWH